MLACGPSENGYTVKGTSKGLDSLGYVADSLFARAERPVDIPAATPGSTRTVSSRSDARNAGPTTGDPNPRREPDTVRGVIVLSGNPPVRQPMLQIPGGDLVALSGMAGGGFSRLEGMELRVKGVMITSRDVVVSGFLVVGRGGKPVFDGRLSESGGAWSLQLTDGSGNKRLNSVPTPLRQLVGSRVWVGVDKSGVPSSFGEILRR